MADVEKQVRQMANFIKLEAQEKANEIKMKAQADADLEKQMAVMNGKTKIAEEYERKEKAQAMEQKIKASVEERRQRSRLLAARDDFIQKLNAEAKARLAAAASSNTTAYTNLLKALIKQGVERLDGEEKIEVRCRPQDLATAQKVGPAAAAAVVEEAKAAGIVRNISLTVIGEPALASSAGGVIVSACDGRIRCNNTLEERLTLALGELTPVVRDLLFPSARAEARVKPAVNLAHVSHGAPAPAPPAPAPAAAAPAPAAAAAGTGAAPAADPFAF